MFQNEYGLTVTAHPTSQGPGPIARDRNNLLFMLDHAEVLSLIETLTRAFDHTDKVTINIAFPSEGLFYPKDRD